jgi:glutaredoxin 3
MANVLMYTTGSCLYCQSAERLLREKRAAVQTIRVDLEPERRAEMMRRSGRRTVPQIWIGERHIGGCDDLYALDRQGKLEPLLEADS